MNERIYHVEHRHLFINEGNRQLIWSITEGRTLENSDFWKNELINVLQTANIIPEGENKPRPTTEEPSTLPSCPTRGRRSTDKMRWLLICSMITVALILFLVMASYYRDRFVPFYRERLVPIYRDRLVPFYRRKIGAWSAWSAAESGQMVKPKDGLQDSQAGKAKSVSKEKVKNVSKEKLKGASKEKLKSSPKEKLKETSKERLKSPSKEKAKPGLQTKI